MTRMAAAAPEGDAPRFREFLHEATGGDHELQRYLQRIAGYCLTGSTTEHALFFLFGPGGTGKSVLINVLAELVGDYAATASMDFFTVATGERHPADLASLNAARLVTATETEEGRRWNEAKVKAITGGDRITAHFMRRDPFTFTPMFKLLMCGNFRPAMRSADDAMRRRLHLTPFNHKPTTPDHGLLEKLRHEFGGIMQWAVEGCLEWQRIGLASPRVVVEATAEYFEIENVLGRWIDERCHRGKDQCGTTKALFFDFAEWAKAAGEYAGTERRFYQRLLQLGFERERWREAALLDALDALGLSTVSVRAMAEQGKPINAGGRRYSVGELEAALQANGSDLNLEARLTLKMALSNAGLIGRREI